jgi:putative hemolysin
MDLLLLLSLILLNGVFAMSEIAVVSARNARLQRLADDGSPGARSALALSRNPSTFLSTIQVGITSVGILSGAIGETALADPLTQWLQDHAAMREYARPVALIIVVVGLTYFAVVVGELVPKRLGLLAPEAIASLIARPMNWLSRLAHPLVWLLSASSDLLLRLLGARRSDEPPVTDEEIDVLMGQGAKAGVFHASEQRIVANVLRLDEQNIRSIMTPRKDIYAVDLTAPEDEIREIIANSPHDRIVVCRDGVEHVVGVLRTADLLNAALLCKPLDPEAAARPPLYVPESITTVRLLENFRSARRRFALVVDEYGELQGVVTLTDVMTAIVGELPSSLLPDGQDIVPREDGSWLVDGGTSIERMKAALGMEDDLPDEEENYYHTVGGLVTHVLGRIPSVADRFEHGDWRFEVVDMDRNRVDRLMISRPRGPYAKDKAET